MGSIDGYLSPVLHNDLRYPVKGGDQSGDGDMFSQEEAFRSPAESAGHTSRQYHSELLVRIISTEEKEVIIGLRIIPAGINSAIYHGYLAQVEFGLEYRDGIDPVTPVVSPGIAWIPSGIIPVHTPGPVDITVSGVVQYMIIMDVRIIVVMDFYSPGRIYIMVVISSIIPLGRVLIHPVRSCIYSGPGAPVGAAGIVRRTDAHGLPGTLLL